MAKMGIIIVAPSIEFSRYEIVLPPEIKFAPIIIIFEMLTVLYICSVPPNKI